MSWPGAPVMPMTVPGCWVGAGAGAGGATGAGVTSGTGSGAAGVAGSSTCEASGMDDVDEDDVEVELDALDEVKEVVSSVSVGSTGVVHPESVSIPEARRARAVREFMGESFGRCSGRGTARL